MNSDSAVETSRGGPLSREGALEEMKGDDDEKREKSFISRKKRWKEKQVRTIRDYRKNESMTGTTIRCFTSTEWYYTGIPEHPDVVKIRGALPGILAIWVWRNATETLRIETNKNQILATWQENF